MRKVIIGIHGLGNKPPKYLLNKWWKDAILEGLEIQDISKKLPRFEMVYWADILYDKPLNALIRDIKDPLFMDEPYIKGAPDFITEDHSIRKKVVDFISEQMNKIFLNADKSLNYSFITDFIVHKYFKDLEAYYTAECNDENNEVCKAREIIRKRIATTIRKYKKYKIMIIAHSMGSIIAIDVLNFLIKDVNIDTLVTIGSPLGFPVVVSKIAAEQKEKWNGKTSISTPPGIINKWYNLADIMDKVALNYKLADDFAENSIGVGPQDILVLNNYEINGHKNPHKSYGYLRTPEFSRILSEFIGGREMNMAQRVKNKVRKVVDNIKLRGEIVKDRLNLK
ncbi:MAG: lipase family protein [Bacteroidales bacterium]|nr:lipase family protein [Bacteroidales bacterium]